MLGVPILRTSQLQIRVAHHKAKKGPEPFAARYNIDQLVYYEVFETIDEATARESAIKNMHRLKKIKLIVSLNPNWQDLSEDAAIFEKSHANSRVKVGIFTE